MKRKMNVWTMAAFGLALSLSAPLTGCSNDDDGSTAGKREEIYKSWLETAEYYYDHVQDSMAFNIENGAAELKEVCSAVSGKLAIPSEVYYPGTKKSYPVTVVNIMLREECSLVTELEIPNTVTRCYILQVKNIKSLNIPSSVEALSIEYCDNLEYVDLKDGLENVFIHSCPKIEAVDLPSSVKTVTCRDLEIEDIELPASVTDINFNGCSKLKLIKDLAYTSLYGLDAADLMGCTSLMELVLPQTVTYVTRGSCEGCTSLNTVICLATTPPAMRESSQFSDVFAVYDNLYVPEGCADAYRNVWPWSEFKEIIER